MLIVLTVFELQILDMLRPIVPDTGEGVQNISRNCLKNERSGNCAFDRREQRFLVTAQIRRLRLGYRGGANGRRAGAGDRMVWQS